MTYRELAAKKTPELISDEYKGGVYGCPFHHGFEGKDDTPCDRFKVPIPEGMCDACWGRDIPDDILEVLKK